MPKKVIPKDQKKSDEQALLRLLDESEYFKREEALSRLTVFLLALAAGIALIFLTLLPWEGMRPLVVRFHGFWFRYSVIGDIVLALACIHRARALWHIGNSNMGASLLPSITACLACGHALTSFHDPWGIFFSNALIEFLLLVSILILMYTLVSPALSSPLSRCVRAVFITSLLLLAFLSLAAQSLGLIGFTARSLPMRLFAARDAGGYFLQMRWLTLVVGLFAIALISYALHARVRLDPGLAGIRERALLSRARKRGDT